MFGGAGAAVGSSFGSSFWFVLFLVGACLLLFCVCMWLFCHALWFCSGCLVNVCCCVVPVFNLFAGYIVCCFMGLQWMFVVHSWFFGVVWCLLVVTRHVHIC